MDSPGGAVSSPAGSTLVVNMFTHLLFEFVCGCAQVSTMFIIQRVTNRTRSICFNFGIMFESSQSLRMQRLVHNDLSEYKV